MINEHDVVFLTHDLQKYGLEQGHRGTVVHCYADGQGFEVEFIEPPHVLTLEKNDIKLDKTVIQTQVAAIVDCLPAEEAVEVRNFAESLKQKHLSKAS